MTSKQKQIDSMESRLDEMCEIYRLTADTELIPKIKKLSKQIIELIRS